MQLGFEKEFRSWADAHDVRWERLQYPRPGGMTTAYRLTPAQPPRATVVVAHGAGNDALFGLTGLFKSCLDLGLQVFSFDVDGHGRDSSSVLSGDGVVDALADAVDRSGAPAAGLPVHLIGISFGGAVTLHALPRLDRQITSAVVIVAPLEIQFSWGAVLNEIGLQLVSTVWQQREHFGLTGLIPSFGPFRRGAYPLRLNNPVNGGFSYITELNRIIQKLDPKASAAKSDIPILLIYGSDDRLVPAAQGKRLADRPGRDLYIVDGGTHLTTPFDAGAGQRLIEWIEEHTSSAADRVRR